jgi:hypothetical protein
MSGQLSLFALFASFHLIVFNVLRAIIAREDGERFSLVDALGWLDARSPRARRYRSFTIAWLCLGILGTVLFFVV